MRKLIFINLFLLTVFCVASVFAQGKTSVSENQCEMAVKDGFVSEKISLNVVNTDIRDILNYITEQFGCNFFLEEKIGEVKVTARISDIPWNTALKTILEDHQLDMMIKKVTSVETGKARKAVFVATKEKILRETEWWRYCFPKEKAPDENSLYTEFIKLENLPICPNNNKCEQLSIALNKLNAYIAQRLTENGQVEIDESSQILIITDLRDNLNILRELAPLLDNEEFYNTAEKVNNKKRL